MAFHASFSPRFKIVIVAFILFSGCSQSEQKPFNLEAETKIWNRVDKNWEESELRVLYAGRQVYRKNCSVCHAVGGTGDMQIGAPALKRSPLAQQKDELILRILLGKQGSMMPAFADTLSDNELAAVASFVKNAWENHADELISAAAVANLR